VQLHCCQESQQIWLANRILQIISKAMNFFQPADIKKRKRTNTVGSGNDELISLLTRMLTPLKYELSRVNIFQPRSKINFASNKNLSDIEVFRTQIQFCV
jgi:hypothetical protein